MVTSEEKNQELLRDTRVEVDLGRIAYNMKQIREMAGPEVAIMPVIKANGYGHGAAAIAPTLIDEGAAYLAVATLTEALDLKDINPSWPVFIMGHTPDRLLHHVVEKDITQTIFSLEQAELLNELAGNSGKRAKVHIKVDTGFHRLGKVPSGDFADEVCRIFDLPGVEVEGIFTHLALTGDVENEEQFRLFTDFTAEL